MDEEHFFSCRRGEQHFLPAFFEEPPVKNLKNRYIVDSDRKILEELLAKPAGQSRHFACRFMFERGGSATMSHTGTELTPGIAHKKVDFATDFRILPGTICFSDWSLRFRPQASSEPFCRFYGKDFSFFSKTNFSFFRLYGCIFQSGIYII